MVTLCYTVCRRTVKKDEEEDSKATKKEEPGEEDDDEDDRRRDDEEDVLIREVRYKLERFVCTSVKNLPRFPNPCHACACLLCNHEEP